MSNSEVDRGDVAERASRTQTFLLRATRFNDRQVRHLLEWQAERQGLRLWVRTQSQGWLRREITVTVHGSGSGISAFVNGIEAVRHVTVSGGAP